MNERSYVLITVLVSSSKRRRRRKLISLQKKLRKIKKGCEMEPEPGKLGLIYTVLPQFIRKNRVLFTASPWYSSNKNVTLLG